MSNQVTIEPCEFTNVRSGHVTKGFRMYDDHAQAYDNTWDSIPDDDMDVLDKVCESDNVEIKDMLLFIRENQKGINIGGEFYNYEAIKAYLP